MIKIDRIFFTDKLLLEFSKNIDKKGFEGFSVTKGFEAIPANAITEFKIGRKFVYKVNKLTSRSKSINFAHDLIVREFLNKLPLNSAAKAYVPGLSYLDFLEPHRTNHDFLRVDLKNFFHSITNNVLYTTFEPYFKSESVHKRSKQLLLTAFVNLVTFDVPNKSKNEIFAGTTVLPMGFKTSPVISNVVFRKIDILIEEFCASNGINYTRYADDMLFSSKTNSGLYAHSSDKIFGSKKDTNFIHSKRFIDEIAFLVSANGFKLNSQKTISTTHTISLNGYTIEGSNFSDTIGSIRISNKKTAVIARLLQKLEVNKSTIDIMKDLYGFKVSTKAFKYVPVKTKHVERYCDDQVYNKLGGYRSYLISLLKYNDRHQCINVGAIEKYNGLLKKIEKLMGEFAKADKTSN
jgi:RNA-directed DNA polymerase